MSGRGAAAGFDFQSRANAYVLVHILAERSLSWTQLASGDVPLAVQAESGGSGDDIRIELVGSTTIYECQAKRGLNADSRLDDAIDGFSRMAGRDQERGILIIDPRSSRPVSIDLLDALDLHRQGVVVAERGSFQRVVVRLRANNAEAVARRIYVRSLDIENDASPGAQLALTILERGLDNADQAAAAWGVLIADGLRMCREGGRRSREAILDLLGHAKIYVSRDSRSSVKKLDEVHSMVEQLVASRNISNPPTPTNAELDKFTIQLDAAKHLLDKGLWQAASDLLEALGEQISTAQPATRVRRHNLYAVSLLRLDRDEDAKTQLQKALELAPNDTTALANLAQTELFLGNTLDAQRYAERATRIDPMQKGAWGVLVQLSSDASPPDKLAEAPEILAASAIREMRLEQWTDAVEHLRVSVEGSFDPERALLLAQSLYGRAFAGRDPELFSGDLEAARDVLDRIIRIVDRKNDSGFVERALVTRGQIHRLFGDQQAALADFIEARAVSPNSVRAAYMLSVAYLERGEPTEALAAIKNADQEDFGIPLATIRARAYLRLNRPEEARAALAEAEKLLNKQTSDGDLPSLIVELAIELSDLDLAEKVISKTTREGWLNQLFLARIAARRGDDAGARAAFEESIRAAPPLERPQLSGEYAEYRRRTGDAKGALEILEAAHPLTNKLLRPIYGRTLYEAKELVKASALLDKVNEEAGEFPSWALQLGANVALVSDDVPGAVRFLGALYDRRREDYEIALRFAQVSIRARDIVTALRILDDLRDRGLATPRQRLHMAELYIRAGRPGEALPLAYRAARLEPDAEDVQLAYVNVFLRREDELEGKDPTEIQADTFVELETDRGDKLSYFIVTDEPARRNAGELELGDNIAKELMGKRVGDSITFRQGSPSEAKATVVSIKSNLVHVFQEILLHFPQRYPQSTELHSFKVPEDPTIEDFSFLNESLKQRAKQGEELLTRYAESGGLPLGFLAQALDRNIVTAYDAIADSHTQPLLVEFADARDRSASAAKSTDPAVITRSALHTASRLELLPLVFTVHPRLVIPQSLLDEMAEERYELEEHARHGYMAMIHSEKGPIPRGASAEYFQQELARFDRMFDWLLENCEVRPRPLKSIEGDNRLREIIGASSFDTLVLAEDLKGEIYADDLGLRRLLLERTKRFGFSSYGVLLAARGTSIPDAEADELTAGLIRLRHESILLTPAVFLAALVKNAFRVDARMMPLLERLRDPGVTVPSVVSFIVASLLEIAVAPHGGAHVGPLTYALTEAGCTGRDARTVVSLVERVARMKMQVLPMELDAALAALKRYTAFVILGQQPLEV